MAGAFAEGHYHSSSAEVVGSAEACWSPKRVRGWHPGVNLTRRTVVTGGVAAGGSETSSRRTHRVRGFLSGVDTTCSTQACLHVWPGGPAGSVLHLLGFTRGHLACTSKKYPHLPNSYRRGTAWALGSAHRSAAHPRRAGQRRGPGRRQAPSRLGGTPVSAWLPGPALGGKCLWPHRRLARE